MSKMRKLFVLFILPILGSFILFNNAFASLTIANKTNWPVWIAFTAAGCAGVQFYGRWPGGIDLVCYAVKLPKKSTINYTFPWGTSFRNATLMASFPKKGMTRNDIFFRKRYGTSGNGTMTIELGFPDRGGVINNSK